MQSLHDKVEAATSFNYEKVMLGLLVSPVEYDCKQLKNAMKGVGTDEDCLIEIICTRSSQEMEAINKKYKESS